MGKKKSNAAKKRADHRRQARVTARESERAKSREKATKFTQSLQTFNERLKAIAAEQKEKVEQADPAQPSGTLPKPDWQGQDKTGNGEFIYWRWDITSDQASVNAHYYLTDSDDGRFTRGDFIVTVRMVANEEIFSAEESRRFGEALISAYAWKQVWRNFTGEYIANGGWSNEVLEAAKRSEEIENELNRVETENNAVADMEREKPSVRIEHLHIHDDGMIGTSPNCPGGEPITGPELQHDNQTTPRKRAPWCRGSEALRADSKVLCRTCGREDVFREDGSMKRHEFRPVPDFRNAQNVP